MKKLSVLCLVVLLVLSLCVPAMAATTTLTYASRGVEIPATLVTPDGADTYPLVVLIHGHGGNREENVGFGAVAAELEERGIASIRMDFPGCGESTESFQLNTLTNMKADVLAARDFVENVSSVGFLGYSMGGRIVLELLVEGTEADAIALLAPAADTADLKALFGGTEAYDAMAIAAADAGYVEYTTIYGQLQELSKEWFGDLEKYTDLPAKAAAAYDGAALVIWGSDDEAVSPSVSAAVAEALGAETLDATGEGHGYGFYSETREVLDLVSNGIADFFAANLK